MENKNKMGANAQKGHEGQDSQRQDSQRQERSEGTHKAGDGRE